MTVASQTNSQSYVSSGALTPVSIAFPYAAPTDVVAFTVDVSGQETPLAYGSDYSVTGSGRDGTGIFTPLVVIANGVTVRIRRDTNLTQSYNPVAGTPFSSAALEIALDDTVMAVQDQDRDLVRISARALLVPDGETAPAMESLAGGDGKVLGIVGGVIKPVSSSAVDLAADIADLQAQIDAKADDIFFAAKFDAVVITNPTAFTIGGNSVTCVGAAFTQADVGKIIYCTRGGTGYNFPILPLGTITAVASATQITTSTVWTESYGAGITYELIYGTDDTAALVAIGAALVASKGNTLTFPSGRTILRRAFIDWTSRVGTPLNIYVQVDLGTTFHLSPEYDFTSTSADGGFSNLIFKHAAQGSVEQGYMRGFIISGSLAERTAANTYNGFTCPFHDSVMTNVRVESLHGFASGIRLASRVRLENVHSRRHGFTGSSYPTKAIHSVANVTGTGVLTSNCVGPGLQLENIVYDAANTTSPTGFSDSLFDECNGGAVVLINTQGAVFGNCTMFGGPNSEPGGGNAEAWALRLRTNSTCIANDCQITGYGNDTSRKSTRVEAGSTLWVNGVSELNAAGNGTGVTLDNLGTVYVGPAVEIIGIVTGAAPILLGGSGSPPWTIAQTTGLQGALDAKVDDSQISAFGLTLVDDADATTARTTLELGNVTNTSDANKPVSTAQQTALDLKVDDSQISAFGLTLVDDADATTARTTLGLGNVTNTSDADKPVSTAQQTALDLKVDDTQIAEGTYTPTLTNVANLDASTAYLCHYLRVGNTVIVSGHVGVNPTTAALSTELGITLPIASNLGATTDCNGNAASTTSARQSAGVYGDIANDRAAMVWLPTDIVDHSIHFTFTYRII